MTAWTEAWSECTKRVEPNRCSQPGVNETIPAGMRSEITALLANMILSVQQEATL